MHTICLNNRTGWRTITSGPGAIQGVLVVVVRLLHNFSTYSNTIQYYPTTRAMSRNGRMFTSSLCVYANIESRARQCDSRSSARDWSEMADTTPHHNIDPIRGRVYIYNTLLPASPVEQHDRSLVSCSRFLPGCTRGIWSAIPPSSIRRLVSWSARIQTSGELPYSFNHNVNTTAEISSVRYHTPV